MLTFIVFGLLTTAGVLLAMVGMIMAMEDIMEERRRVKAKRDGSQRAE